jgi:hypothetical protein
MIGASHRFVLRPLTATISNVKERRGIGFASVERTVVYSKGEEAGDQGTDQ